MAFTGTFDATVLADSVSNGASRLVTMELTYPRCIHSEFMTHRMFSRNAASSRAIPIKTMINRVRNHPFIPEVWGLNKKGMQASGTHSSPAICETMWRAACGSAIDTAEALDAQGLHKQIVNRVLEPWMWITVIASGVDAAWENFFTLRCHKDAEPHIQRAAYMARRVYDKKEKLKHLRHGDMHLPLLGFKGDELLAPMTQARVSVARCARVSYLTHDGKRDTVADLALYARLLENNHWSPFEHVATAVPTGGDNNGGNFGPAWEQHRKTFKRLEYNRTPTR